MTAPEPTAVERTIAEAVRSVTDLWDEPLDDVHDVPPLVRAVVAAVRNLPAEQMADLIRGEVEKVMKPEWYDSGEPAPGYWLPGQAGRLLPNGNRSDLRFVPSERVVGPWVEVSP